MTGALEAILACFAVSIGNCSWYLRKIRLYIFAWTTVHVLTRPPYMSNTAYVSPMEKLTFRLHWWIHRTNTSFAEEIFGRWKTNDVIIRGKQILINVRLPLTDRPTVRQWITACFTRFLWLNNPIDLESAFQIYRSKSSFRFYFGSDSC